MSRRHFTGPALAVALAFSLLLTACGGSSQSGQSAHQLVIGAAAEPSALDPSSNPDAAIPQVLLYNVYETLVRVDAEGKLKPLLAASWTVSPDARTYTFALQPKAKFSDGTPVDGQAVVNSIKLMTSGAKTTATIKAEMSAVKSVTAPEAHTVVVQLSRPSQSWIWSMASTPGIVIAASALKDMSRPVGSGPFVFTDWKKGDSISVSKNTNYWGTPPKFDKVTFRYFTDANAMNAAMLSGDLDIISQVAAPQAISQFSDASEYTVYDGTSTGEVILGFNFKTAALDNLKVRQAINLAIDRKSLLQTVWNGMGTLIGSMVPPTDPWYADLHGYYPYDPAKAKELLKEAGYASGLTLRLRVPNLPYAPPSAQFIASELKTVGITLKVDTLQFPAGWLKTVFTDGDYDMTIVDHAEPRDMDRFADPTYYWHYNNTSYQKLLAAADASTDNATYINDMKAAAKILATDAAADFLWLMPNLVVARADISGINPNQTSLSFDLTSLASSNG